MNKELQEIIDTIITAARLIGYEIIPMGPSVTYIYGEQGPPVYMVLALYELENDKNKIHTFCGKSTTFDAHHSHEEKVDHLKSLLQKL